MPRNKSIDEQNGFPILMTYSLTIGIAVSAIGCAVTSTKVNGLGLIFLGLSALAVIVVPLVLWLNEQRRIYLRDSIISICWALVFVILLGYPVFIAMRLGKHIPLQDNRFMLWDHCLGVSVPAIYQWAKGNWFGRLANASYPQLLIFMRAAVLVPIFAGKLRATNKFLLANVIAFAISLPLLTLFPAVGPWVPYHIIGTPDQMQLISTIDSMRQEGPKAYTYPVGVWCFPSFHVVWSILSAWSLSHVRFFKIPACLVGSLIAFSTLTTLNHYFCDVLCGVFVACAAICIVERLSWKRVNTHTLSWSVSIHRPYPDAEKLLCRYTLSLN